MSFFDDDPSQPEPQHQQQQEQEESFFSLRSPQQPPIAGPSTPPRGGRALSPAPSVPGDYANHQYGHNDDNLNDDDDEQAERQKQLLESEGHVVQRLTRRWMDERNAPDLLPHDPHGEMDACLQMLLRQQDAVNDLQSDIHNWDEVEHIRLLLVQQEVERMRWLVSSLMRCRLSKIEAQHMALLQDDKYRQRLSFEEQQFLERYEVLRSNDVQHLVLNLLPRKLHSMNDQPGMIHLPDLDAAVYIQVIRPCEPVRLPDGEMQELEQGSIHMLRYRTVKGLLSQGKVRLV